MVLNDEGVNKPHLLSSNADDNPKIDNSSGLDEGASANMFKEKGMHDKKAITKMQILSGINSIQSLIIKIKETPMTKDVKSENT